jgi:hypothetical protein
MPDAPDDPSPSEVLAGAEGEMAEDELALFKDLMASAVARIPPDAEMTAAEMRSEIERLMSEDPRFREVAERLALRQRFSGHA